MLMKTLEINENSQKNQGVVLTELVISRLIIALEYQAIKVMLRHSTNTVWVVTKKSNFNTH